MPNTLGTDRGRADAARPVEVTLMKPGRIVLSAAALLTLVSTWGPARADLLSRPPAVAPLSPAPQRAALAADHRGRMILLGGRSESMTVAASSDDGRSWTTPVALEANTGRYSGAALCVDQFGRSFAAWRFAAQGIGPGEIHAASFRFSEAAGGAIPTLSVMRLDQGFEATDSGEPALDCDEEGRALVTWEEQTRPSGGHDLLGVLIDQFDHNTSRPLKLSAPLADDNVAPDPDLRAGGIGHVVFTGRFAGSSRIFLATLEAALLDVKVKEIPTDGPVVPPILPHQEIDPRLAHQSSPAAGD